MPLTNAFYEAVSSENIRRVRIMMKDSLLVDPTFHEFDEMVSKSELLEGLYDSHDGRNVLEDTDQWTDDYMNKLMVQLVGNFSHERIAHTKEVVRHLRPTHSYAHVKVEPSFDSHSQKSSSTSDYTKQKKQDQNVGTYIKSGVTTGVVIGAVAGGIIASVAGITVLGGATAGAVAGGGIAYVATHGGK